MPEPQDDEERGGGDTPGADTYGVGRLLAFSDGVFAIAITLLVLNIPIPDLPKGATDADLQQALLHDGAGLAGFALSFYVVGTQWFVHHRLLRVVQRLTPALMWLNLGLLLFVCLLPFSTALLVRYGGLTLAVQLYALNVVVTNLLGVTMRVHLSWRRRARGSTWPLARSLVAPLVFLISIPIASWSPSYAELTWLLLIPTLRFLPGAPESGVGDA
jgi:uncharacterized membrane protein